MQDAASNASIAEAKLLAEIQVTRESSEKACKLADAQATRINDLEEECVRQSSQMKRCLESLENHMNEFRGELQSCKRSRKD